ncbi:glycosyltransferase family 2 protein [Pontibacter pamirensis]|uniref:glycosyltransferase family 2 protein n=1 Tax=Pontibacter pamirensis TaxID=2562824 RepID=UPI00138A1E49|nr:glycosyltransferase [Pontibacter pamirensis]
MNRTPSVPPVIQPLPPSGERPLWSVMIPTYNCAQFLTQTLESVLAQNIPQQEMQIEVVDDASTDADVEALVKRVGNGRIGYYRHPLNVGSLRNFETCINRAQGKLVHLLHGDDRVRAGYYKVLGQLFEDYPEAGAAFCRYQPVNEQNEPVPGLRSPEIAKPGLLKNWLLRISERQRLQYVAITVKREVYEKLGAFYGINYGEDWEMWVRIAKHYPIAYTPEILAEYRKHMSSISGQKQLSGQYLRDAAYVIDLFQHHLPVENRKAQRHKARRHFAHYGIITANRIWKSSKDKAAVKTNLRQALVLNNDAVICYRAAKVYIKMLINW